jgi:RNA polymerase sigma-B factor
MRDAALFARLRELRDLRDAGDPRFDASAYESTRDELIVRNLGLAHHLAAKFAERGEPLPDLVQVAALGLINAIDRYDLERGAEFSTYATPTILGELKRHFRDKGWSLKGPRQLRELSAAIVRAGDELTVANGTPPTVGEIAKKLGVTAEAVIGARELALASALVSLDEPAFDQGRASVGDGVASVESELEHLVGRLTIEGALETLSGRERVVVLLRFYGDASQSEIARRLGVSQMQVSRLQHKALAKLRAALRDAPDEGPGTGPS